MKLRLWLRLFLTFAAISSVALAGFVLWQQHAFRGGFRAYLDEVTLERMQPLAESLAEAYAEHGDWSFLRGNPREFARLVDADLRRLLRPQRDADDFPGPPPPPPPDEDEGPPGPDRYERRPPPHPARLAAHSVRERLVLLDADGKLIVGNPHTRGAVAGLPVLLDGQPIGSLQLAPLPELRGANDLAFVRAQADNALVGGVAILALSLVLAFALARWLLTPVRNLSRGTQALAAGDLSHRVEAGRRDELGDLARDFNQLASRLEENREARRRWGADIAHELRTPLSILRGEIQALQDGLRKPDAAALDSLQAECDRLGGLIEDLYQLALADSGALEYRMESVRFDALVEAALEAMATTFAEHGLQLERQLAAVPPLRGDARRLAQLLDNLLVNSLRYTDAPGLVRVVLEQTASDVHLRIEDSAPGVPDSALPLLFERLYRVDASRSRAAGGAGLGLAIVEAIVKAHGGRITAQASSLGGLCVDVFLPTAEGRA